MFDTNCRVYWCDKCLERENKTREMVIDAANSDDEELCLACVKCTYCQYFSKIEEEKDGDRHTD